MAVPVGPPATIDDLRGVVGEVVRPATTANFEVGQFCERFEQVSDGDATASLDANP